MTSRDFCYWLQGYIELKNSEPVPSGCTSEWVFLPDQVQAIKRHLNMVFAHEIDPSRGSKEHQELLSKLHSGSFEVKTNC
jgi:hypothetical protein